ncbi:MAG: FAD-dependent oxidoreductase [Kiloniellales bacterium]|nr:FAD-dependent oxidoreductase [Kiloniellales bacterium]
MKSHARVVVIGGGAMGAGLLYHLTKEGWSDVVLIDKGELTSGSTWHAAGLIPHFIGGLSMAAIHAHGVELYKTLEAETGQATGWHGCGAIRLATKPDEVDWFRYVQGQLAYIGVEMHIIGPNEIKNLHPLLNVEGILAGAYTPHDGHTDPASATHAMAKGARMGGAEIVLRNRVLDTKQRASGEWEVITEQGTITCEHVVNAAGSFGDQVSAWIDYRVPIVNMSHQYLVTENLAEVEALDKEPPVVRDPIASAYYRQEQKGILIGPYEMENAQAWGLDGIDWGFDMELLPPDLDQISTSLEHAMHRLPCFETAGIKRIVNGPITHLPDGSFLLGPAPGVKNYWMCCGASIGITQGPGAGKYLAQWMVHGQADINMYGLDPRRYGDWSLGDYALQKSIDEYQQMYQVHYPGEFREAGRPVRTTPLYGKLKNQGAVYAEVFGWERPKWFAPDGAEEEYGFRRTSTFDHVAEECRAVRERVGVFDLSSFAKFEVAGPDAEALLNRLLANRMPRKDGGIVLAHHLTEAGRIESEFTVTRVHEGRYYLLSAAVAELRDLDFLTQDRRGGETATATNVTDDYGVLVLTGPKSRDVLGALTDADLSSGAFRWLTARTIAVAGVDLHALRVSYAGELGWELHTPMARLEQVYDALMEVGQAHGIADFGAYALNSLRMEKGYKGWGSELTNEITPIEAGLDRFVDLDKGDFVGREALVARRGNGIDLKLVYLDVDAADADPLGNEPVHANGATVGVTTSGGYGHAVGKSLAFAYVKPAQAAPETALEVTIQGERRACRVLAKPAYDPGNERLRA